MAPVKETRAIANDPAEEYPPEDYSPEEPPPFDTEDRPHIGKPFDQLLTAVQQRPESNRLYHSLMQAEYGRFEGGILELKASPTHAKTIQDSKALLLDLWAKITGADCRDVVVSGDEDPAGTPRQDPTEHPGIRSLIEKYPGKIIVQRKVED